MKWQTHTQIPDFGFKINHQTNVLLLGSCFAENIGEKLSLSKFKTVQNPTGIVFNPFSEAQTSHLLCSQKVFTAEDLTNANDLFFSYAHHSRFSNFDKTVALKNINDALARARKMLPETDVVFISLGTAFYWMLLENNQVVNNCHKQPAALFTQKLADVATCQNALQNVIDGLKNQNPNLKVIFTISPIRHLKQGSSQNQLSKATLLVAAHEVLKNNQNVFYFPSYELVLDDLRDYRFYTEDLIHPTKAAIDYIWQKFGDVFFTTETISINKKIESLQNLLAHRVFNPANAPKIQVKIAAQITALSHATPLDFTPDFELWKKQNFIL